MARNARKLVLMVMMVVASAGLTGCELLDALLAAAPGGTGAGPVANHPQGSSTAQKIGGVLGALGNAVAPRQPQGNGGFTPAFDPGFAPGPSSNGGFRPGPTSNGGGPVDNGGFVPANDGPSLRGQPVDEAAAAKPRIDAVAAGENGLRQGSGSVDEPFV